MEANRIFDNSKGKISQGQSMRIATSLVTGEPLSKADQKALERTPTQGSRGGSSQKAVNAIKQFEAVKQKFTEAVATGNGRAQQQLMIDLNRAFRGLARFPEIEAGFDSSGKWPYAKLRTPQGSIGLVPQQPAAPAAPGQFTEEEQAYAAQYKVPLQTARDHLSKY